MKLLRISLIGIYVLHVILPIEPSDELLVTDNNIKHVTVDAMKAEIKNNPTADVQPTVCILS